MSKEIGRNLRTIRRDRHISQKELAEQIQVSQSVVSQWEQGEILPSVENLILICKELKVSSDVLLGLDGGEE